MDSMSPARVSTVQHRGATQIPEEVRKVLKLKEGDRLYWQPLSEQSAQVYKVMVEVKKTS
jgi:bifunctional DNA-binding transcriptional regulator/antitoxin component of YhaV-PrlF toxin-antitoxin module